jgi:asparagine N-glycosylation enzyme membrane subunit Stt3
VALAAWGKLIAAGFFATLEVAIILVPVLAIVFGLLLYVTLEVVMLGLLKVGRAVKGASGRKPTGTLNPVASNNLEAPAPPPEFNLEASQV